MMEQKGRVVKRGLSLAIIVVISGVIDRVRGDIVRVEAWGLCRA
jgi:hypothetical protein